MMIFANANQLRKGAIVTLDRSSVIIFQYNPDSLTRDIKAQAAISSSDTPGDRREALRLQGPPQERISLVVEIDAVDQMTNLTNTLGLYPTLASLEVLLYPKSTLMIANEILAATGVVEIIAPEAPLTLFVWGPRRVLPVRLTEFTITEEEFDSALNPIRAKVNLNLQVLTYQDLGLTSAGGALFMAHQVTKEAMASISRINASISSFF